jgi:hypothetical protein
MEARGIARELESRAAAGEFVDGVHMAGLYTALGDAATALGWLDRAYQERSASMVSLAVHPWHDPLRDEPAFRELLRRMRLDGDQA